MPKQNVRYGYALDKNGRLISIRDSKEMSDIFICPHCKSEMIGKYGQHNQWHFAHKKKQCEYDKYLHTVAEQRIMDWFNISKNVNIRIPIIIKCSKYNQCKLRDYNCKKSDMRIFDIKKWFASAEQEKSFFKDGDKFIADIFLNNKTNSEIPLFLEICVTHRCEQKKIDSGIKIIEFDIESESDIESIVNAPYIEENEHIRFYNFKTKEMYGQISEFPEKSIYKFVLLKPNEEYSYKSSCHEERKGIFEATINWDIEAGSYWHSLAEFKDAFLVAASQYYPFKSCVFCMHQIERDCYHECSLYNKIEGIHKKCRMNNPTVCQHYQEDKEKTSFLLNKFDSYKNKEVWIKDM